MHCGTVFAHPPPSLEVDTRYSSHNHGIHLDLVRRLDGTDRLFRQRYDHLLDGNRGSGAQRAQAHLGRTRFDLLVETAGRPDQRNHDPGKRCDDHGTRAASTNPTSHQLGSHESPGHNYRFR